MSDDPRTEPFPKRDLEEERIMTGEIAYTDGARVEDFTVYLRCNGDGSCCG